MMRYLMAGLAGAGICWGCQQLVSVQAEPPGPLEFPPITGTHQVIVTRVVDGDTVDIAWLVRDRARLYGINAPEIRGDERAKGIAARDWLRCLLDNRPRVAVAHGRDKYGRILLDLHHQGQSVGHLAIEAGHAVPYP